jgi:ligand-binding SRPBCC domain-containing protein
LEDLCGDFSHELEIEQWVAGDPDDVFEFFSDARNLERITPPHLKFNVLDVSTNELREGTLIDYALRLHGLPIRWQSRIEDWKPNDRFVDVQTRGPYALWQHRHEFEPHEGGTIVRDRVRYRMPLGALGDLVAGSFVRSDLRRIFDYRRVQMMSLFPPKTEQAWDEV